ncbi:Phosphonate monoester hydrolase [Cupriavidus necator]|uniref:Phosphonate monoester hydrolase n=1 Tax=Cupriavidus necator TaxID=106590 RepID=A0A1K0JH47_CUPNE|nr:Phosphonate monoester hydrolase [Cupriavidus necator]
MIRNVLFIMCDQLRRDHLSCYGHPYLATRNIDLLASRGVRFDNAFVQSGVCGPSRMSYYTGRYPSSHGTTWNRVPLPISELTLGEYLRPCGRALALAGKTHFQNDVHAMQRLSIEGDSELGRLLDAGGFVEVDRYDGHKEPHHDAGYARYLRAHGYASDNPWNDFVVGAIDESGQVVSGHAMRHVHLPARVGREHSETAYTTNQAIDFINRQGDAPWVMHLSYIKPHWPYLAPAPYHALYTYDQCLPVHRHQSELRNPHPVLAAYRQQEECANMMRDEVVRKVRPAYQGLVQEIDDNLGRLWETLDRLGRWQDTLIVFTSDHGDFLGDHWLGEKEHFYDTVQRVPYLLYDPSPAADSSRGTARADFVEAIDTVPTILDALDVPVAVERIEGTSLLALTRGTPAAWRDAVFSELDYSFRTARKLLGRDPHQCRAWMVRTAAWKYVYWLDLPPQLFDLTRDPDEFHDLGGDPAFESVRADMQQRLFAWFARLKRRTTVSAAEVEARTDTHAAHGVIFGVW